MARTTVSSKYQVVIPREIRTTIPVQAGQQLEVVAKGGVITMIPVRPLASLRGFIKGMPVAALREKKDRS